MTVHAGDCYYAGIDHPRRTCHGAIVEEALCPRCGSPEQAWRRVVPGSNWGRVCNDGWHLAAEWQPQCRACHELITGERVRVTVTRGGGQVLTVNAHEKCRAAAHAVALEELYGRRE